jgi:hypothetical protein
MATDKVDSALQYVGPIMEAYSAAEKAGASALRFALECGKHLCSAFNTVDPNGKGRGWKKWREKNLKEASEETERVYRRLAVAVGKQEDVFAECTSIRAALKHLSGLDENLNPKPTPTRRPGATRTGSSATGLQPPETDTPSTGLKAELENAGADEIIANIQDDDDKLEELAQASIIKLTPDKVCDALIGAWDADQLRDLAKLISAHLHTMGPSTARDLGVRPIPLAQPSPTT